jgi:shikimate kinase/3-dehydroquinate synthase
MPARRPLVIWGPPASGKSTLAKQLGRSRGMRVVDVDEEIERASRVSIATLFAAKGEPAFRPLEREHLERALAEGAEVIAVGGGALLDRSFRHALLRRAHVVSLDASRDTLLARVRRQGNARPLLADDPARRLDELLDARGDAYAEVHARIDANGPVRETLGKLRDAAERSSTHAILVVPLGRRTYRVHVGPARLLGAEIAALAPSQIVYVSDARVREHVGGPRHFGIARTTVELDLRGRGDREKNLATVSRLWDAALSAGIDRHALVVGVGGGVVTDLAGFVAATLLRGLRYASAPTTLLAMVDASVGGKTGFDHAAGKNLLGAFHQPSLVVCDPAALATVSARERRAGLAEIAKIALACDPALVASLERASDALRTLQPEALAPFIAPAIQAKIDVVVRDEREQGERALLNFGHTIGHAIEHAARFAIPHGECVALGMRAALDVGMCERVTPADVARRANRLLDALGMPHHPDRALALDDVMTALGRDKKRRNGSLRFVLCEDLGRAVVRPVARANVRAAVRRLLEIRPR